MVVVKMRRMDVMKKRKRKLRWDKTLSVAVGITGERKRTEENRVELELVMLSIILLNLLLLLLLLLHMPLPFG